MNPTITHQEFHASRLTDEWPSAQENMTVETALSTVCEALPGFEHRLAELHEKHLAVECLRASLVIVRAAAAPSSASAKIPAATARQIVIFANALADSWPQAETGLRITAALEEVVSKVPDILSRISGLPSPSALLLFALVTIQQLGASRASTPDALTDAATAPAATT